MKLETYAEIISSHVNGNNMQFLSKLTTRKRVIKFIKMYLDENTIEGTEALLNMVNRLHDAAR